MVSPGRPPVAYAVAGMIAMAVAMGIGRFVYTPILPGMMDGLGLSVADAGLIASANYAGYLVGAIVAAGSWGRGIERATALGGLLATALLCAAMALSESVAVFVLVRFLAGLASALVMIFASTIVFARFAEAGRPQLQAWHFGGVGLGIAISAVMTGALLLAGADWRSDWLGAGLIALCGLAVVALLLDRPPGTATRPAPEPAMPRGAALTRIILAYGLFGFGYIVTATFLVAIVRQGEAGRLFESVVWLATGLAGLPSVWLWSILARRHGLTRIFAVACVVEAAGVVASVSLGAHLGPLLGGVLLGGTFIAITAMGLQIGRGMAGAAQRRVLAVMTASFGIGQIVGPIAAAIVAERTGSFTAPSLLAAAALILAAAIGSRAVRPA